MEEASNQSIVDSINAGIQEVTDQVAANATAGQNETAEDHHIFATIIAKVNGFSLLKRPIFEGVEPTMDNARLAVKLTFDKVREIGRAKGKEQEYVDQMKDTWDRIGKQFDSEGNVISENKLKENIYGTDWNPYDD